MRPVLAALAVGALILSACSAGPLKGVDTQKLADNVGVAIGDPSTCVLLSDSHNGHVLWRGAPPSVCGAKHPRCVAPGLASPYQVLRDLREGADLTASCNSGPAGSSVGWAAGQVNARLSYVAVMDGDRALPGREIRSRVLEAFSQSGIKP